MTRTTLLRALVALTALLPALASPGCGERPLTQLVVVADTDLLVPTQVDGIEVEIMPSEGAPVRRAGVLAGSGAILLPASLGVVHRGGPLGPVSITARALRGSEPIVTREAEVYFVEGRTLLLSIHLEAACVGVPCATGETCEAGTCRSVVVTRDELRDFDGTLPHLADGGGGCTPLPELCNGADDDCDARVDEGVDVSANPFHCGICDNACPARPHARPACAAGLCAVECEPGYGDCNDDPRDGCEAALNTLAMCAECAVECAAPHGAPTCFLGTCDVQSCAPGWGDCNDAPGDGCEAPLNDPMHCGGCTPCTIAGAIESCVDGACAIAACDPGLGDCNGLPGDGCEAPLTTVAACGACGRACPAVARGTAACAAGDCIVGSCTTGFADCDASASNGCETALDTMADCGACGAPCALPNATEICGAGGCEIAACDPGWGDCNGSATDGCETSLETASDCGVCEVACAGATPLCGRTGATRSCVSACSGALTMCGGGCVETDTSVAHCGGCDRPCAPAHAAGECRGGLCAIGMCDPGWGDCNGSATDGCETSLDTMTNCGACGDACSLAFASEACAAGRCQLVACEGGHGDCDGDGATGCETALASSVDCGGCGIACDLAGASESCATGTCEIVGCETDRGDCNGIASDGCETTLGSLTDCRACGDVCDVPRATETCATGACGLGTCDAGWDDCNATLADGCETPLDTLTDCGRCGASCGPFDHAVGTCETGSCVRTCDPGWGDCNGSASDGCEAPLNTAANCGACGMACTGATSVCGPSGPGVACQSACGAGMMACGSDCVDLSTDEAHCGACDAPCAPENATGACVAGGCRIASCSAGWDDCNGAVGDGCEQNVRTLTDCGGCGIACASRPNATASCGSGSCVQTCNPGWGDCDGTSSNGCERSLSTITSCGSCSTTCGAVSNATVGCTAGACVIASCASLRGDCNGIYSDGCERNLRNDDNNCGMCGRVCPSGDDCSNGVCD